MNRATTKGAITAHPYLMILLSFFTSIHIVRFGYRLSNVHLSWLISPARRQNGTGKSLKAVTWHFFKRKMRFRQHFIQFFSRESTKLFRRNSCLERNCSHPQLFTGGKRLLWLLKFSHVNDSRFWLLKSNVAAPQLISLRRLHRELFSTVTDESWKETKLDLWKSKSVVMCGRKTENNRMWFIE